MGEPQRAMVDALGLIPTTSARGNAATRADFLWRVERFGPETAEWWATRDAETAARESRERAEKREMTLRRIAAFRLPITARDVALIADSKLDATKLRERVAAWFGSGNDAKPWSVLCGPVGRGKTLTVAEVLVRAGGRYVGARELERLSMAKFGEDQSAFQALLDTRGLLVIDDLGREDDAGRMQSALLDVVDYRRGIGHRTAAITNFAKKGFVERYPDERLQSRLAECAEWIVDVGPDMRRSKS